MTGGKFFDQKLKNAWLQNELIWFLHIWNSVIIILRDSFKKEAKCTQKEFKWKEWKKEENKGKEKREYEKRQEK